MGLFRGNWILTKLFSSFFFLEELIDVNENEKSAHCTNRDPSIEKQILLWTDGDPTLLPQCLSRLNEEVYFRCLRH